MTDRTVSVRLRAEVADFKRQMAEATKATEQVGKGTEDAAKQADTALGRMVQSATKNQQAWDRTGATLTAFGAVTTVAFGATVKAAMDWESAWTGVLKTADGSGAQLAALEGDLRNLAKTLPATHQEIAAVAEAAGQLGVGVDSVASFTKTMIDLGETTNLSADEAATAIAQMANVMNPKLLTSSDGVSRFGATLVALGNDGASTEKQILEMAQRISGSGKLVGASEAEVLALSNALASMGITAELGGGVVSRILQDIYSAVKSGGPQLEQFARLAGQSADEFAKSFANDPVRALDAVAQGLNGVDASGGNVVATLTDLGFKSSEEQRVLLQLKGAGDLLTESLDLANVAWAENSALIEEANKRYDTAEAKVQIAQNSIKDAAITIGDAFLPVVAAAAEGVADLANWFGSLPAPVQQAIGGLTGVVGAVSLAAGGFMLLFPRVIETVTAFKTLSTVSPGVVAGIGKVGKAAGIAGAALAVMAASSALPKWGVETSEGAGVATNALLDVASGAKTADQAFAAMTSRGGFKDWLTGNDVDSIQKAWQVLKDPGAAQNIDNTVSSILTLGQASSTNRMQAEELFASIDEGLSSLVASGAADQAKAALDGLGIPIADQTSLFPLYADALEGVDAAQKIAGVSADGLASDLESVDPATKAATEALAAWMKMVSDADGSFSDISAAYQGVIDKNKEVAQATADATSSSKDSWEDFYDGTSVSMDDWIAKLQEQAQAQANWQDNILAITSEIRTQMPADMAATADAMIDELIALGPDGAAALQTFRDANAEQRILLVEAWAGTGTEISADFASELDAARAPTLEVDADTASAAEDLAAIVAQADSATGTITMDGDMGPVSQVLTGVRASIDAAAGTVTILGDDGQAVTTLTSFRYSVDATTGAVTIQGKDAQGRGTVVTLRDWINAQGAAVTVGADTSGASGAVDRFIATMSRRTITVGVSAATIVGNPSMGFVPGGFTGGSVGRIAGFASGGQAPGGQVPGTPPGDPTRDNVFAMTELGRPLMVRSKEWIQPQPTVEYYGADVMRALQYRQIPKSALAGFAAGGSPSMPQYAYSPPAQSPSSAPSLDLTGLQLVGTLMVNGMEARMEAVAVGVVDARDRSEANTRQTVGRVH